MPPYRRWSYSGEFTTSSLHFFIDTAELFGPGASVLCKQQLQASFSALILLLVLLILQRSLTRKRTVDMAASRDFRLFSINEFGAVCPWVSVRGSSSCR